MLLTDAISVQAIESVDRNILKAALLISVVVLHAKFTLFVAQAAVKEDSVTCGVAVGVGEGVGVGVTTDGAGGAA